MVGFIQCMKELFNLNGKPKRLEQPFHAEPVKIFNFTFSMWGHDMSTHKMDEEGKRISFIGHAAWSPRIWDYFLFNSSGSDVTHCRYIITDIVWLQDPRDMYSGHAEFIPSRTEQQRDDDQKMVDSHTPVRMEDPVVPE